MGLPALLLCGMAALRLLTPVLWRSCWHLMPPYGGQVGGRVACPFCQGEASSETEMKGAVEGLGGEPSSEAEIAPRV